MVKIVFVPNPARTRLTKNSRGLLLVLRFLSAACLQDIRAPASRRSLLIDRLHRLLDHFAMHARVFSSVTTRIRPNF